MSHKVDKNAIKYFEQLDDIKMTSKLKNVEQVKDVMGYTNLSADKLAEELKSSSMENILHIDKADYDYIINNSDVSPITVIKELKKQGKSIYHIDLGYLKDFLKQLSIESAKDLNKQKQ